MADKRELREIILTILIVSILVVAPFIAIISLSAPVTQLPSSIEPDPSVDTSTNSTPSCSATSICPSMLQEAYGFDSLLDSNISGAGQTIVVVDACGDPTLQADLQTFDSTFGLPNPSLKISDIGGTPCFDAGWAGETALDVEWAHVTAPGAAIYLLVAAVPNPHDIYGAWSFALNNHLGNQISNSFGGAGCYNGACNSRLGQGIGDCLSTRGTGGVNVGEILNKAEAENVTVIAGAGDQGAFGVNATQVEAIPADCAGVLTVGGTTLSINSTGGYEGETAWNDSTGGGYVSNGEPKYQLYANITNPYGLLGKPDVAADGDPATGVVVYTNGTWAVIGGTSLSAPLWAGFVADVNQMRAGNGLKPLGFLNPFLYEVVYGVNGSSPLYSQDFHDIISGYNNPWSSGPGWDPTTGLGSFIVPALAQTLSTNPAA